MKKSKIFASFLISTVFITSMFAGKYTFTGSDGVPVSIEIPDAFDKIMDDYYYEIQSTITEEGVTSSDLEEAKTQLEEALNSEESGLTEFTEKYDTLISVLEGFSKDLIGSLPSAQAMQNQWAQAWIGSIFPGFNFGFGLNIGVSTVSLKSLVSAADALEFDQFSDLPIDFLPLPTINADVRIGGVILPFDVGFSIMKFDSSRYNEINDMLGGFGIDYFTMGLDVRYALLKDLPLKTKVAVNGGLYYTNTSFTYADTNDGMVSDANINFGAFTFSAGAQASAKLAFLVPYVGTRFMFSWGNLDWSLTPNWAAMLGTENSENSEASGAQAASADAITALLPKSLGSTISRFGFYPQFYAGLGFDLFAFDITTGIGYTFVSNVLTGTISFRIAWN